MLAYEIIYGTWYEELAFSAFPFSIVLIQTLIVLLLGYIFYDISKYEVWVGGIGLAYYLLNVGRCVSEPDNHLQLIFALILVAFSAAFLFGGIVRCYTREEPTCLVERWPVKYHHALIAIAAVYMLAYLTWVVYAYCFFTPFSDFDSYLGSYGYWTKEGFRPDGLWNVLQWTVFLLLAYLPFFSYIRQLRKGLTPPRYFYLPAFDYEFTNHGRSLALLSGLYYLNIFLLVPLAFWLWTERTYTCVFGVTDGYGYWMDDYDFNSVFAVFLLMLFVPQMLICLACSIGKAAQAEMPARPSADC